MYPRAICWRRVEFVGRLTAAACIIYLGSIVSVAGIPNPTVNIIEADDAPLDLGCDNDNQSTPKFSIVDLDAVTLRVPEVIRILRVPVRCFYCRCEHRPQSWYHKYEFDPVS
jgi:hypothetical protein